MTFDRKALNQMELSWGGTMNKMQGEMRLHDYHSVINKNHRSSNQNHFCHIKTCSTVLAVAS